MRSDRSKAPSSSDLSFPHSSLYACNPVAKHLLREPATHRPKFKGDWTCVASEKCCNVFYVTVDFVSFAFIPQTCLDSLKPSILIPMHLSFELRRPLGPKKSIGTGLGTAEVLCKEIWAWRYFTGMRYRGDELIVLDDAFKPFRPSQSHRTHH